MAASHAISSSGPSNPASLMGGATLSDAPHLFNDTLDKIAAACIPQFEKIAGTDMTVSCVLGTTTMETAGDVLASVDPIAVTGLFDIPALSTRLLVSLDHDFVQLTIELMCGGMCTEPPRSTPRPGTGIDRQFARVVFNLLASTIDKTCQGFGVGSVSFGQIETKLDPAALGKRTIKVALATFTVTCRNRLASFRVAFPQPFIDRFKQDVLAPSKEVAASDPVWTEHFQAEIGRAAIKLDAFLHASSLSLGDITTLRVGQILQLPKSAPSRCELRSDDKLLFRCELGQADGRYSLRIEEMSPSDTDEDAPSPFELSSLFSSP